LSRTHKTGLDYFSFDVDFFNDPKVEFVSAKYDELGELIIIKILCRIYRNGYYLSWDEDQSILFTKRAGNNINQSLVDDVVNELLHRDFFCNKKYKKHKILTSNGIQKRFFEATKRRKEINVYKEYLIADVNDYNVNINDLNVDINQQRKVKESKGKNISKAKTMPPLFEDYKPSDKMKKWCQDHGIDNRTTLIIMLKLVLIGIELIIKCRLIGN
jgi:hypothetical protein